MTVYSGYKLLDSQGNTVQEWNGQPGIITGPPNPLILPNGVQICAPEINVPYDGGYMLVLINPL